MRETVSARQWVENELLSSKGAKASDFGFRKAYPSVDLGIVLPVRISGPQPNPESLDDQIFFDLIPAIEKLGYKIVTIIPRIGPAYDTDNDKSWSTWISECASLARERNASLLFRSTERAIRTKYDPLKQNWNYSPTKEEFERFIELTQSVQILTVLDPDLPPDGLDIKRHRKMRSLEAGGSKGGRPEANKPGYKLQRRMKLFDIVNDLFTKGATYRQIAAETQLPVMTIYDWTKR